MPIFQSGLELGPESYYLPREADDLLPKRLLAGGFSAVLAPRQTGKSSLRAKLQSRLSEDVTVISIDLASLGVDQMVDGESERRWYYTLAWLIGRKLGMEHVARVLWQEEFGSELVRFSKFLSKIPEQSNRHVIVFLDEIDRVFLIPFLGQEFLAVLRRACVLRSVSETRGLSICVLGVAVPEQVLEGGNAGVVETELFTLSDFTRKQLAPFEAGLGILDEPPAVVLDQIFAWTGGHPAMTQRLCSELLERRKHTPDPRCSVEALVKSIYLTDGIMTEVILSETAARFDAELHSGQVESRHRALALYRRLLASGPIPETETADAFELRMSGLASVREGTLTTRNRIFETTFDSEWINSRAKELEQRMRGSLADILAALYPSPEAVSIISSDAGLDLTAIEFVSTPRDRWESIILRATKFGRIASIVEFACQDFPDYRVKLLSFGANSPQFPVRSFNSTEPDSRE